MTDPTQEEPLGGAPDHNREAAVAPVIAEIAARLKSRLLTKIDLLDNHGYPDLGAQLVKMLQDDAIDPNLIQQIDVTKVNIGLSAITALVPTLRSATAITRFELRSTSVGDAGVILVASALRNASGLTFLGFRYESLGNTGAIALARELGQWPLLQQLSLSNNEIGCAGAKALGEAMGAHSVIYNFSLRSNPLGDEGVVALFSGLRQNTSLTMAVLEDCQIRDPKTFLSMPLHNVERYYLGKNPIERQGGVEIASILRSSTVTVLGLDGCGLGAVSAVGLAEILKMNATLTALSLNGNTFNDDGAIAFADCLRHNTGLNTVNLAQNGIGDAGATAIAAALAHNETLGQLVLTNNQIGTTGYKAFINFLQFRCNLFQLSIAENPATCDDRKLLRAAFHHSSTVLVDVVDEVFDGKSESAGAANTIAEAITGAANNTVISICITQQDFSYESWKILMEALEVSTSVKSFHFYRHESTTRLAYANAMIDLLAEVLERNKTLTTLVCYDLHTGGRENRLPPTNPQMRMAHLTLGIVKSLRVNCTLERLSLNKCTMTSKEVVALAEALQQNPSSSLRALQLMNNLEMGDESAAALAKMLLTNSSIEELALCVDSIGDPGATALSSALRTNQHITVLRLQSNEIGPNGAQAIAGALAESQQFRVLQLDANRVGDLGATAIADALKRGNSLVELTLGTNEIGDDGCHAIASAVRDVASLRTLILSGNKVTTSGAAVLFTALSHAKCALETLALAGNPIATIGVEFLHTQSINTVSLNYADLAWPPPSVSSRASRDDRSAIYRFLDSAAASSSLLVRSRLMLVGHGGAGKTTLKTALLMSSNYSELRKLRESILEIIQTKWLESDMQSWVDVDLAETPGFFKENCPGAVGITGARWLEYRQSQLIAVFGASETETARRVVQKMVEVLCFLQPQMISEAASAELPSTTTAPNKGWEWITGVVLEALERSGHSFGDFVGIDNPSTSGGLDHSSQQPIRYDALLNLPHVWTEGIELESWDDAGYTVWDLPGQMELYPSHQMFSASATAVYVLVVNGGNGIDVSMPRLSRWLSSLRSGFRHSLDEGIKVPVRIVLSHTDALTKLERTALMREVLHLAGQRFADDFDFGPTCFAVLYGEEGGGDPSTGVDALRSELVGLRTHGVERHPLPTPYQRCCDDVVERARSDEMSRWPIVDVAILPKYDHPLEDILGCLGDLGFIQKVNNHRVILEPVTWLSRLMVAFLHPFHGVGNAIANSTNVKTLREHLAAVTITSVAASRIVNQRGRIIEEENEGEVLAMLSHVDVCFELKNDCFVFPMLLPAVTGRVPWLDKSFVLQLDETAAEARRYRCRNVNDTVPPTLAALLMEAVLRMDTCQPVYLGRCTLIAYSSDRKCYVGLHQSTDDSTIDLFAVGEAQQQYLGLVTLNFAVLVAEHYPRLRMQQSLLQPIGLSTNNSIPNPTADEIDHVLLGPCIAVPSDDSDVDDTLLGLAALRVPTWMWQSCEAVILGSGCATPDFVYDRQYIDDDALPVSSWKKSAVRQTLVDNCKSLCAWIDLYSPDVEGLKNTPLRGCPLLIDILGARNTPTTPNEQIIFGITDVPPHMCGISFEVLKEVYDEAAALAGEEFENWTMRDINRCIVRPLCAKHGTSLALVHNPNGLAAEIFVSHAWGESFKHFAECIVATYGSNVRKPTLWICTFALIQSDDPAVIAQQIGPADAPLGDAPFARAMKHAREMLIVRNHTVDIYSRLWCVCEVYFAHTYGLAPDHTKVVGSDTFAGVITTCLDAKCRDRGDRVRILHALLGGSVADTKLVERIDQLIVEFRRFYGEVLQ
eukprot:m.450816 g.450816  ORF g.450816 m.450816 type:complete len:1817 (-) comp20053_c0_seq1:49-5499(-)